MDWLEEIVENIRKKLLDTSLKKSLAVYIASAAIAVIVLTIVTVGLCSGWLKLIDLRYEKYDRMLQEAVSSANNNELYQARIQEALDAKENNMENTDKILEEVLEFIQSWCVLFYSVGAIILVSWLFYRGKLEIPILIIQDGARHVSRSQLDFDCTYMAQDEMGELCQAFDSMRRQLIENYQNTWNLMEEQRCLNAAFAHDLRTPLTVIRGYTEFLKTYYPSGKISQENLMEYLNLIAEQVQRLQDFSNTMKEVNTIEELEPKLRKQNSAELAKKIRDTIEILDGMEGLHLFFSENLPEKQLYADETVIMEVLENLVSNAMRYAKTRIEVSLDMSEDGKYLQVYVQDDGPGFTKEGLEKASGPYYGEKDQTGHFGIGLFLCKVLCEKHQGKLDLSNSIENGAICCASFYVG